MVDVSLRTAYVLQGDGLQWMSSTTRECSLNSTVIPSGPSGLRSTKREPGRGTCGIGQIIAIIYRSTAIHVDFVYFNINKVI